MREDKDDKKTKMEDTNDGRCWWQKMLMTEDVVDWRRQWQMMSMMKDADDRDADDEDCELNAGPVCS